MKNIRIPGNLTPKHKRELAQALVVADGLPLQELANPPVSEPVDRAWFPIISGRDEVIGNKILNLPDNITGPLQKTGVLEYLRIYPEGNIDPKNQQEGYMVNVLALQEALGITKQKHHRSI